MNRLFEGLPTTIIEDGELQQDSLRKELIHEKEVMTALRLHGIDDMREVRLAALEVDGIVSVIKHHWAETVQKSDVDPQAKKERSRVIGKEDEPPEEKRTDSARALGNER